MGNKIRGEKSPGGYNARYEKIGVYLERKNNGY